MRPGWAHLKKLLCLFFVLRSKRDSNPNLTIAKGFWVGSKLPATLEHHQRLGFTQNCRVFGKAQSHHYRIIKGWVCDASSFSMELYPIGL